MAADSNDFARWDERFGVPGFAYGAEPNDFLQSVAAQIPPGRLLSLGEGEGRNAVYLGGLGFAVTGVDGSGVGLAKAQTRAAEAGVSLHTVQADLGEFDVGQTCWEGVVSIFCHLPPGLRRSLHRRVVQGLVPGGVFVLEAYTPQQLRYGTGGPPIEALLLALEDLREDVPELEEVVGRETEREVVEGRLHTGLAHVVQSVGRRV